jgi:hypothetical protein
VAEEIASITVSRRVALLESVAMRWPSFEFSRIDTGGIWRWAGVAGVALVWITGNQGVAVTFWWGVLAVAACGIAASLLGFGKVFDLLFVILLCAALIPIQYCH